MTHEERQKEKAYIREMKALGKLIKKYPESISPDMQEKIAEYNIWKIIDPLGFG